MSLLRTLSESANLRAFLRIIREGETSQTDDAYRTQVYGRQLDSLADHPREVITGTIGGREVRSSAAGAYQFLRSTWNECAAALGLTDFGQQSQDAAAVYLIRRRGALDDVLAGRVREAIAKCNREWASLPGAPYGQPTKTLERALEVYREWGGVERPADQPAPIETRTVKTSASPKEPPVSKATDILTHPATSFLLAAVNPLLAVVPELAKIFMDKDGTTVPERNVAAAVKLVEVAQQALTKAGEPTPNAQSVVEAIQADPAARETVRQAVLSDPYWLVTETGGGGIEGARKADLAAQAAHKGEPWWAVMRSPSFIVALGLLPLVYMIVGNVVGLFGDPLSDEVRSAIANGIPMLILGGLIGYYYGQTTSRNRGPIGTGQ
jgi:muramidase (phage lysozyme)